MEEMKKEKSVKFTKSADFFKNLQVLFFILLFFFRIIKMSKNNKKRKNEEKIKIFICI